MENRKQPADFHFSLCWLFCINEIWKIENNHQISIFLSIGCFVKIDQLIWKVNITVITNIEDRLATRNHSECGHQQLHCKLDSECWPNCTTVRITLQLRFGFAKCISYLIFQMSVILNIATTLQCSLFV